MTGTVASAPGKLHLAGEYAVLAGGSAVAAAVDRRAIARAGRSGAASPFLTALADVLAEAGHADAAAAVPTIAVDTAALFAGAHKLGLGSSAAATVAACACALAPELDRDAIHGYARAAHARAQLARGAGVRGSGVDIAAAVHGGVIAVTPPSADDGLPSVRRLALPPLAVIAFAVGPPADTVTLVAAVTAAPDRRGVAAAIDAIARACDALIAATTTAAAIDAIAAGGDAIGQLAGAADVALEPPAVAAARAIARRAGGAAKTTGAGGGDLGIVVVPPDADLAAVRRALGDAGAPPVDLRIDARGVDIEAPGV